jgi:hypothetical protein
MGNKCVSAAQTSRIPPPSTGTYLSSGKIRDIIKSELPDAETYASDGEYFAYDKAQLQAFLKADRTNLIKYKSESFDCDDFARVLVGREREWFRSHNQGDRGSTLGTVWGDIRPSEEHDEPYPHAVNFFVDEHEKLWLVEPQSDALTKPTSNSTFWFACV